LSKPSKETLEILRNIQTEIGAGMVLIPRSDAEHAHNNACDRANRIISNYAEGYGLFQMVADGKARQAVAASADQAPEIPSPSISRTERSSRSGPKRKAH